MRLENLTLGFRRRRNLAAGEARHQLAKDRGMVLGLRKTLRPLDTEALERLAQPCKWAPIQGTSQVVGCVGQEPAASEPVEEIEILRLHALGICFGSGFCESRVRRTKRACVASQKSKRAQHSVIRAARKQCRKQRIFLRTRAIDIVDRAHGS